MPRWLLQITLITAAVLLPATDSLPAVESSPGDWEQLEPGLHLGTFSAPVPSEQGDSLIHVLRADTSHFELRLLNASAPSQGKRQTAREWAQNNTLVAAINASMYQANLSTSISLMRSRGHVNSARLSKDKTLLAFDPIDSTYPEVQIIDRECQDFDRLKDKYRSLVQSIRMVSCQGKNVWKTQNDKWSIAAIGVDTEGRVLFIHVRSPYGTHELIDMLLKLPLSLDRAMYVEGGTQAQLYINTPAKEYEFLGGYSSASETGNGNQFAWPLPNIIGLVRKNEGAQKTVSPTPRRNP